MGPPGKNVLITFWKIHCIPLFLTNSGLIHTKGAVLSSHIPNLCFCNHGRRKDFFQGDSKVDISRCDQRDFFYQRCSWRK